MKKFFIDLALGLGLLFGSLLIGSIVITLTMHETAVYLSLALHVIFVVIYFVWSKKLRLHRLNSCSSCGEKVVGNERKCLKCKKSVVRSTYGIGCLAVIILFVAVAIYSFSSRGQHFYCTAQMSDLHNLAAEQEAFFAERNVYAKGIDTLPNFKNSPQVTISMQTYPETAKGPTYFTATAKHEECKKDPSVWDSSKGGLQREPMMK